MAQVTGLRLDLGTEFIPAAIGIHGLIHGLRCPGFSYSAAAIGISATGSSLVGRFSSRFSLIRTTEVIGTGGGEWRIDFVRLERFGRLGDPPEVRGGHRSYQSKSLLSTFCGTSQIPHHRDIYPAFSGLSFFFSFP